jgi:lipoic acid synthetase
VETVPSLYPKVRPQADYRRSLGVLAQAAEALGPSAAKSGLMLGLGERAPEVRRVLGDLVAAGCRRLTLGQYLPPSERHAPLARYVRPSEFVRWREESLALGFERVDSAPLVRSSYHAEAPMADREGGEAP